MHHFYKNRLARCYLGASRTNQRNPNPSTGFDEKDDLAMAALDPTRPEQQPNDKPTGEGFEAPYDGPLPIINATLNLVHGEKLAWQERKGTSFFWTPLFSGFECSNGVLPPSNRTDIAPSAYRATQDYAYSPGGIHIGTAVAVSGVITRQPAPRSE